MASDESRKGVRMVVWENVIGHRCHGELRHEREGGER
jgi:hypothetical protein